MCGHEGRRRRQRTDNLAERVRRDRLADAKLLEAHVRAELQPQRLLRLLVRRVHIEIIDNGVGAAEAGDDDAALVRVVREPVGAVHRRDLGAAPGDVEILHALAVLWHERLDKPFETGGQEDLVVDALQRREEADGGDCRFQLVLGDLFAGLAAVDVDAASDGAGRKRARLA